MAAPKGNQYAKECLYSGRPRKTSFTEAEMIALGEEMILWVKKNSPIHLSQWYTIEKGFIYREWKTFIQREEFIPYYECALKLVGMNYLDGTIKESLAQRWQRVYFKDLKEEEDDTAEFNAKLKTEEAKLVSEADAKRTEQVIEQMRLSQDLAKAQPDLKFT